MDSFFRMSVVAFLAVMAAGEAEHARHMEIVDPEGLRQGFAVEQGARLDLFDRENNRTGYGIRRPDGSWDLFNKDGSLPAPQPSRQAGHLGVIYPGQPARIILQPRRR